MKTFLHLGGCLFFKPALYHWAQNHSCLLTIFNWLGFFYCCLSPPMIPHYKRKIYRGQWSAPAVYFGLYLFLLFPGYIFQKNEEQKSLCVKKLHTLNNEQIFQLWGQYRLCFPTLKEACLCQAIKHIPRLKLAYNKLNYVFKRKKKHWAFLRINISLKEGYMIVSVLSAWRDLLNQVWTEGLCLLV